MTTLLGSAAGAGVVVVFNCEWPVKASLEEHRTVHREGLIRSTRNSNDNIKSIYCS